MKKRYVLATLLAFVLAAPQVFAVDDDDDDAPAATPAEKPVASPETAPKDAWLAQMATALPAAVCGEKTYFRSCFTMAAADCTKAATDLTKKCSVKLASQIPANLTKLEAEKWGGQLGACVGTDFEKDNLAKRTSTPACNDPSKW